MKKLLIASTALVMVAGAASADVTLGGYGRLGMTYNGARGGDDGNPNSTDKAQLYYRLNLDIKVSKTTDSGLTFGAKYRLRNSAYQTRTIDDVTYGSNGVNEGQVYVQGGGLTVAVGNVADAIDAMDLYYDDELGLTYYGDGDVSDNFNDYASNSGTQNQGISLAYTIGTLKLLASYHKNSNLHSAGGASAVSATYAMGPLSFGGAWSRDEDSKSEIGMLLAAYKFGDSTVGIQYGYQKNRGVFNSYYSDTGSVNQYTLYGNTKFGAYGVQAYVTKVYGDGKGVNTDTGFGIGGTYDLGSGAFVNGSVNKLMEGDAFADLGIQFNF